MIEGHAGGLEIVRVASSSTLSEHAVLFPHLPVHFLSTKISPLVRIMAPFALPPLIHHHNVLLLQRGIPSEIKNTLISISLALLAVVVILFIIIAIMCCRRR